MSLFKTYVKWSRAIKTKKNWICAVCKKQNIENKQSKKTEDKIVCHHIQPVKNYGVRSPLLMDEKNIVVCCQFCHLVKFHRVQPSMISTCGFFAGKQRFDKLNNQKIETNYGWEV